MFSRLKVALEFWSSSQCKTGAGRRRKRALVAALRVDARNLVRDLWPVEGLSAVVFGGCAKACMDGGFREARHEATLRYAGGLSKVRSE